MRVGLIGTGVVGRRVARELVARPEVSAVVLLSGSPKVRARLRDSLGPKAQVGPSGQVDSVTLDQSGVTAVVLCTPDEVQVEAAGVAIGAGCHVVSLADSVASVDSLCSMDEFARDVGVTLIVGAAMSPGWSTVLARHGATLFEEIEEVSIAVAGSAGPACHERRTRAARSDTQEWRDGEWVECAARSGSELVWFPDPIGAVDSARGDLSDALMLRRVLPAVGQIVVKVGRPTNHPVQRRLRRLRGAPGVHDLGAVRVAISGRVDGQPATIVYGVLATPAAATAVLAALAVGALASEAAPVRPGVSGVAELLEPAAALRAAAARGVGALIYEGID